VRLFLIACSKTKLPRPAPAAELYNSPLFKFSRQYAEKHGEYLILSAEHGLVNPSHLVEPYDTTLADLGVAQTTAMIAKVERQAQQWLQLWDHDEKKLPGALELLAGRDYAAIINATCLADFFRIHQPLKGLGIGQRLQWLKNNLRHD